MSEEGLVYFHSQFYLHFNEISHLLETMLLLCPTKLYLLMCLENLDPICWQKEVSTSDLVIDRIYVYTIHCLHLNKMWCQWSPLLFRVLKINESTFKMLQLLIAKWSSWMIYWWVHEWEQMWMMIKGACPSC